jgi:hypothetical protein
VAASAIAGAARQAAANPKETAADWVKRLPIMQPIFFIQQALKQKPLLLTNEAFQNLVTDPAIIAAIKDKPAQDTICEILLANQLEYVATEGAEESLSALIAATVRLAETPELASAVKKLMSNQAVLLDPDATSEAKSAAVRRLAGIGASFLHLGQGSILSLSKTIAKNRAFVEAMLEPMVREYIAPVALIPLLTDPYVRVELASALEAFSVGGVPALLADKSTQSLVTSDVVLTALATPPAPGAVAEALLGPGGALEYATATYDMQVDWSADGLPSAEEAYQSASKALGAIIKATAQCAKAPEVASIVRIVMAQQALLLDPNAASEAKSAATLSYIEALTRLLGSQHAVALSEAVQTHKEFVVAVLDPIVGKYVSPEAVVKLAAEPGTCADLSEVLFVFSKSGAKALLGSQAAQRLMTSRVVLDVLSTEPVPGVIASTMFAAKPGADEALSALVPEMCKWLQDKKAASGIKTLMGNLAIFFDEQKPTDHRSAAAIDAGIGLLKLLAEKPVSLDSAIDTHKQFIAEALRPYIGAYVKPERVVRLLTNKEACIALAKTLDLYRNNHVVQAIATLCVEAITIKEVRKVVFSAVANAIASVLKPTKKDVGRTAADMPKPPHTMGSGKRDTPGTAAASAA